jgi:hypothetical protein
MSKINSFIELLNNMSNVYDNNLKKSSISYNKLIFKRFLNYYIISIKNKKLVSFSEIINYLNNIEKNTINTKYIQNNDIDFFNNFLLNNIINTNNSDLIEFILIYNIKEKITSKTIFLQFINDIKHLLVIDNFDIDSLKKIDDFYDNYESLLCTIMKQSENLSGPFIDVYKLNSNKINEINNILENYKIKKK